MSRNPRVTGADLIAALERVGFRVLRIKGSHHFLRHEDGRSTVVPVHSGETIGPGLLHRILRDCQLTADQPGKLLWERLDVGGSPASGDPLGCNVAYGDKCLVPHCSS